MTEHRRLLVVVALTLTPASSAGPQESLEVFLGPDAVATVMGEDLSVLYRIGDSDGPGALGEGRGTLARTPAGDLLAYTFHTGSSGPIQHFAGGEFVRTFRRPGQGPGEFRIPSVMAVDADSDRVWVHDRGNGRILPYEGDGMPAETVAAQLLDGTGPGADRPEDPPSTRGWLTPGYASPEQLGGAAVTTATDIHQLEVLLYHLLTGRRPSEEEEGSLLRLEEAILHRDPAPPSRTAEAHPEEAPTQGRDLEGDLDAIVLKALRKDPAARYPSARALVEDLDRHRAHRPVTASCGRPSGRTTPA